MSWSGLCIPDVELETLWQLINAKEQRQTSKTTENKTTTATERPSLLSLAKEPGKGQLSKTPNL